jgi:malonate transporter and related proteins
MLAIIEIVTPVFGIILIGWLAVRCGYVGPQAGKSVAEFAFKVAMPGLLFRAMLSIGVMPGSPARLIAAYVCTVAFVWILAASLTRVVLQRPPADAAAIAMGSTFGNTVMLGIPLAISAFGPDAAAPMALLVSIDAPLLWIIATLHIETALRDDAAGAANGKSNLLALQAIILDLLCNPVVLALLIGSVWRIAALPVPNLIDRMLALLAQGAVPAALFALGTGLAAYEIRGQTPTVATIVVLKLFLFPIVAAVTGIYLFHLPRLWVAILILSTAMPVGANAFLFASRYERAVGSVSAAIAVSTAIAVITITLLLYVLRAV